MAAAISVVTFGSSPPPSLPHKILQNNSNAMAMDSNRSTDVLISRNKTNGNDKTTTIAVAKKPRRDTTRVSNPTPIAVARRNARERNRVKQVNNGFAALRQHIPREIAAAFEQQSGHHRNGNKKLSKVETLRMAVEYIRSLEEILSSSSSSSDDSSDNSGNSSSTSSIVSFPSPSPQILTTSNSDNILKPESPKIFQYIRIAASDPQIIIQDNLSGFEDEENIQPIVDNLPIHSGGVFVDSPLADMVFDSYTDEQSLSPVSGSAADVATYNVVEQFGSLPPIDVLQPTNRSIIQTNALISPSSLSSSNHSLSPKLLSPSNSAQPITSTFHPTSVIQMAHTTTIAQQQSIVLYSPQSECDGIKIEMSDNEHLALEDGVVKTEEMIDVMDWWNHTGKFGSMTKVEI